MTKIVFWLAVVSIGYAYVLFPVLLCLRAKLRPRRIAQSAVQPSVTMVICAHNEARSMAAKLDNVLGLDYPRELLQVVVASDGSDDATNEIVAAYADRGVRLIALPRLGKIPTLNTAVTAATNDVLVFSDANSMYATDALRRLVRPFADPTVGCVAGDQRYVSAASVGASTDGERAYWSLDRKLKEWGSAAGSATSATGAMYAIRRSLFRQVPAGVTDDFFISTSAIVLGYRLVFAGDAAAYEHVAARSDMEFRRKVRVITRGLHAVLVQRVLLDPRRYGFYSIQLFSLKFLRRLVVLPLMVILAASVLLWGRGAFYDLCALAQLAFYGAAAVGGLCERLRIPVPKLVGMPFYFCLVNAAALVALINVLRGKRIDRWSPRGEAQATQKLAAGEAVTAQTVGGA